MELKVLARDGLPKESCLRSLILPEPDLVRRAQVLAMLPVYVNLRMANFKGTIP
jgi:hypothetical protein